MKPEAASTTIDVAIDSVPAGAQVLLDGAVLGKTPYHGTLPQRNSNANLLVRLAGYADKTIAVRTSQSIHERVKLVKTSAPTRDQSVNPFAN